MAVTSLPGTRAEIELSTGELIGALGDSITVLPLLVALAATTSVSLAHVLVGFGVFQIVWGLVYGMPLSLEPMKALAGLAIVGALSYPELAAAGLLCGLVLLVGARFGLVGRIQRVVGAPVVRGIQLAVALLLLEAALSLSVADPSLALAGVALVAGCVLAGRFRASALVVLGVGSLAAVAVTGLPTPRLPALTLFPAGTPSFSRGALEGTVAQLGMTVGNAAIATSLLCADLYDRKVSPDDLSRSMGVTCLAAVPFGAIPMCHGSGGLAGKHAFGARTAGANLVLGVGYLALALVAVGALLAAFPMALLGVLLAVVGVELARAALAPIGTRAGFAAVVGVGLLGLVVNVGVAFLLGALAWWLLERRR
ncbi:putative sulfate/molybdate transporter [Natronobiforma cellulositropha]|uniref:putative sulfate/molybdate transporter n=1 Tax=Natronobiforma cellulositropha TaxID=1679076 RepID=UPI0021D58A59|nr:putative sulfate/molybdate transporter [Natronobiforma cellulositropha]